MLNEEAVFVLPFTIFSHLANYAREIYVVNTIAMYGEK